jgi:hypothetical protein
MAEPLNTLMQGAYHRNDLCHRMMFMSAHTWSNKIWWSTLAAIGVTYDMWMVHSSSTFLCGSDIENSFLDLLLGSTVDLGDPITANVPEVPAKHGRLAMIADNLQVGDATYIYITEAQIHLERLQLQCDPSEFSVCC